MSVVNANCPSCGGQVCFRIGSSFVTICDYCSTAVARSDRGLEDRGKVIDLIDSQSPLDLYLAGSYGDSRFEIVGRTQIKHSMGGVWDEWYCAFDSGHWGWLAEAQGRFYMSFRSPLESSPPYGSLQPGALVPGVGQGNLVVSEMGQAQILGAKGEIPYALEPNTSYYYADLSGPEGVFATLDYGDGSATLYLGKEVTLDDIGIAVSAPAREDAAMSVGTAVALECPNCRGSLDLVAPDQAERVGCPYCGALSDVNQGKLSILQILDKERFPDPLLPLGSKGEFEEQEMTVAGYMVRSTEWYGEFFYWEEYLLYNPRIGFRWLTSSDGHWSYVTPVAVADIDRKYGGPKYEGRTYMPFDEVSCQVEFVLGQFYWNVSIGERVSMADFVCAPYSLSEEKSETEVNWSLSTYITKKALEEKFGVTLKNPNAGTVGLNQPYSQKAVYKVFWVMVALAIGAYFFTKSHNKETVVFQETISFEGTAKSESQVAFTKPFKLQGDRNIQVKGYTPLSNSWVYLQFDLINEESGSATFFDLPIEYYSGADWSEGSNEATTYLKAVGAGTYTLRIGTERKDWKRPVNIRVTITEGVTRFWYWLVLLGFIALLPIFTFLHHRSFEMKRWSDASKLGPWWARNSEE